MLYLVGNRGLRSVEDRGLFVLFCGVWCGGVWCGGFLCLEWKFEGNEMGLALCGFDWWFT